MRGQGSMGGFNRPSPYDSRDRFGGMNRYGSRGGGNRGRSKFPFAFLFSDFFFFLT